MKSTIFFKSTITAAFMLAFFTVSFAQVGGSGGNKASIQLASEKKTIVADLSDMLIETDGNLVGKAKQSVVAPKRKFFARLKSNGMVH